MSRNPSDDDENTLLRFAASVEQLSAHILAHSVVEAAQERTLSLSIANDFEEIFGKGLSFIAMIFAAFGFIPPQRAHFYRKRLTSLLS